MGATFQCLYADMRIEACVFEHNAGLTPNVIVTVAGHPVFDRCTFRYNVGQTIFSDFSELVLDNCLFYGNSWLSGPTLGLHGGHVDIRHCTITGNTSAAYEGTLHLSLEPIVAIANTILWGNEPREISSEPGEPLHLAISYSDITGGYAGIGNLDAAPLFADETAGDFTLQTTSPCVDAGDPNFATPGATDLAGHLRRWDGNMDGVAVVDVGAYEHGSFLYGDVNCDGTIDFDDINAFVLALSDAQIYYAEYPACDSLLADANADGGIDFGDINAFLILLGGESRRRSAPRLSRFLIADPYSARARLIRR